MSCICDQHEHEDGFATCTHGRCPCTGVEAPEPKPKKAKPEA